MRKVDASHDSLLFIEVVPLYLAPTDPACAKHNEPPKVSTHMVKQYCFQKLVGLVRNTAGQYNNDYRFLQWGKSIAKTDSHVYNGLWIASIIPKSSPYWVLLREENRVVPVVYVPSEDPTLLDAVPCWMVGYSMSQSANPLVTESTLIRILPTIQAFTLLEESIQPIHLDSMANRKVIRFDMWQDRFTGEKSERRLLESFKRDVFRNHNPGTIDDIRLRISLMLSRTISIGTTEDAFAWKQKQQVRSQALQRNSASQSRKTNIPALETTSIDKDFPLQNLLREGSLTIHSPHHGAGKTLLVQAVAEELGACVHIIHLGPLLSKYGVHADTALESKLHSVVMSAAVQNQPICIILDNLDAMLPPRLSARTAAGDAALPVLNAIASFLKSLTLSIMKYSKFPFPLNNPLYNLGGAKGNCLFVQVCIVGIVTCQDGKRPKENQQTQVSVLDALVGSRYRLPDLSSSTRLSAFRNAFDNELLVLSKSAEFQLPVFAASNISTRGAAFASVANDLRRMLELKGSNRHVEAADFDLLQQSSTGLSENLSVSFFANKCANVDVCSGNVDLFSSVGGNSKAKLALEEALAIDPFKRSALYRFGLQPPAGVLLFGPPGTGKTLLAKAVAILIRSQSAATSLIGGSFISLQASEIVQAEVGTSEQRIVSAFETARRNAPSVIFIDEFQALFTERSGCGSGKLASTLLLCLDDVHRWTAVDMKVTNTLNNTDHDYESNRVVVLGATNMPWMVDKAFLRAGRFDRTVHVGLPSRCDRESILRVHVEKMSLQIVDESIEETIAMLCFELSARTEGFSGADLAALCRAAAVRCLREDSKGSCKVNLSHFLHALADDIAPSSSTALVEQLSKWQP